MKFSDSQEKAIVPHAKKCDELQYEIDRREERIAELQKEVTGFEAKQSEAADAIYAITGCDCRAYHIPCDGHSKS